MKEVDNRRPATPEQIDNMKVCFKLTIESSYHELYVDMVLLEALSKGLMDDMGAETKEFAHNLVSVHANVCYANLCLCVQLRASLKVELGVEKQYNIRRSVVTAHETYKYLFGFKGKTTSWRAIEQQLRSKYPKECGEIAIASNDYLQQYARDTDETLRNVAKHYSDNPAEFFESMENVSERTVTDRLLAAMRFLQPMHSMLVNELRETFGETYLGLWNLKMPEQTFVPIGIGSQEKIDFLKNGIIKYSGMVNTVMRQKAFVETKSKELDIDMSKDPHWKGFIENNVGLHILYNYLDTLTTFRSFTRSEIFEEYRLNLAYLVVSAHEGFKKLYGFDQNKRGESFWNRAIMQSVMESGDASLLKEAKSVEAKLEKLSHEAILNDEDMIDAYTHMGFLKKQKAEAAIAVLHYFVQPIKQNDLDALSDYIYVLNEVMNVYNQVLGWESKRMQQETNAKFTGFYEQIDKIDQLISSKVQDEEQLAKWKESSLRMKEMLKLFEI